MNKDNTYEGSGIHQYYDKSRKLPSETLELWLNTISKYIPKESIKTIIDLGCGTGRFTNSLSNHFEAKVYGIEPSQKMLLKAKDTVSAPAIIFLQGSAEVIPLNNEIVDMIFLSMVYHHIQNKDLAISEFKRVLKKGGYLCIRTSTKESMNGYLWLEFFPNAYSIEINRAPSREGIVDFLQTNGFKLKGHTIIHQLFADNLSKYYEKISLRGLSSLQAITDMEFQKGLNGLKKYCDGHNTEEGVFEEIDLYIFTIA